MRKIFILIKRIVDFFVAVIALIVAAPLMTIAAILIKIDSSGPIFYTQRRVGKDMKIFKIIKFRTMTVGSDQVKNGLQVTANDIRITATGKFLRKTSIDELPQFINVLKGEISLVGPRPCLPEQLKYFSDEQKGRFKVKPGITGLATVNGRASIPWSKRIEFDLVYVDCFSIWLDIKIMLKTVLIVLSGNGTYYDHSNGPAFDLADPDDLPQASRENKNVN